MTKEKISRFLANTPTLPAKQRRGAMLGNGTGIVCNLFLFGVKYLTGYLCGSVAVLSDAFNSLSDCGNCLAAWFGQRMAARPADKGHPFGHGRMEYITALGIGVLIAVMGLELAKSSVEKLLHPEAVVFYWFTVPLLMLSIAVKLWMVHFYRILGDFLHSPVWLANAQDSRNDVLSTGVVLLSTIGSLFTTLPLDGIMGLLVSGLILKTAYDTIKNTINLLLGTPPKVETIAEIYEIIQAHPRILGIHELLLHNYGIGMVYGSCHAEADSRCSFTEIHEEIDGIEAEIREKLHIQMTIHIDPVDLPEEEPEEFSH